MQLHQKCPRLAPRAVSPCEPKPTCTANICSPAGCTPPDARGPPSTLAGLMAKAPAPRLLSRSALPCPGDLLPHTLTCSRGNTVSLLSPLSGCSCFALLGQPALPLPLWVPPLCLQGCAHIFPSLASNGHASPPPHSLAFLGSFCFPVLWTHYVFDFGR